MLTQVSSAIFGRAPNIFCLAGTQPSLKTVKPLPRLYALLRRVSSHIFESPGRLSGSRLQLGCPPRVTLIRLIIRLHKQPPLQGMLPTAAAIKI